MRNLRYKILILLLILIAKPSFSQDFWQIVPTPDTAHPRSMVFNKNGDIFMGSNGVYLSQDTGKTWEFKGIYGKTILSIAIDSVGNIFAGTTGYLYKSYDYGNTWNLVLPNVDNVLSIGICDNGLMFACMPFYIFRSFDYGETWDTSYILPGWQEEANDFAFKPPNTIYVSSTAWMGNGGGVYRSIDYGNTWEHIGLFNYYVQAITLNSSGELFAAVYGHHYTGIGGCYLYDETNLNWIALTDDLNVSDISINSEYTIFLGISDEVGGPGGVYRSLDGGETWQWINSGLSANSIIKMWLSPDEHAYALTYASYTLNRSINPTVMVIDEDIITFKIEAFPNPSSEIIYFKISQVLPALKGSLMIFNIKGDLILKMDLKNTQNSQIIPINTEEWPSGTYCYRIILNNNGQCGKIIKVN
jgi:photosystem II stability/assembly factor-like uncharacterized protein